MSGDRPCFHLVQLTRTEGFPEPVAVLSAGRIWRRVDVEAWAWASGRLS